jgi:hypothetical protein
MRPFFGTYYPWQFAGTGAGHSFMQLVQPKKGIEFTLPPGEGFVIMLIPEGPFRIKADGQIIRPRGYRSAAFFHYEHSAHILIECDGALILLFDASYITMSHPPELMNMYSRWKDLEEEQHIVLTEPVYEFCCHIMQAIQYADQMESGQPAYYGMKILDVLIVKLHEVSRVIENYTEEKRRAKALMFEYLGLVRLHYNDIWNMDQYAKTLMISKDYRISSAAAILANLPQRSFTIIN